MDGRRRVAIVLLALLSTIYGLVFVAGLTGTFQPFAINRPIDVGGLWGLAPVLLALALLVALVMRASATWTVGLFALWFMLAIVEMITVHPYWGVAMAINGGIPLLLLWSDLRRDAFG